jgi:hypothetical protein
LPRGAEVPFTRERAIQKAPARASEWAR